MYYYTLLFMNKPIWQVIDPAVPPSQKGQAKTVKHLPVIALSLAQTLFQSLST